MWPRNGYLNRSVTWSAALDYAGSLSLCGFPDWRLPNVNELESLVNAAVTNTAVWLNTRGFYNVQSNYYWSSTTYTGGTSYAWVVDMWQGYVYSSYKSFDYYYIWPVRSGPSGDSDPLYPANIWKTGQTRCFDSSGNVIFCSGTGQDGELQKGVTIPVPRFVDNGNGVVKDKLTGIMWLKDANCIGTKYPSIGLSGYGDVTWQQALDFIERINNGTYPDCGRGYSDWHLPNRKELYSLVDYSNENAALPADNPFTNVQFDYYWSSTTIPYYSNSVFAMWDGALSYGNKVNDSNYVWPVRFGPIESFDYYCDDDNDNYIDSSIDGNCTGIDCVPTGCQTAPGYDCDDNVPLVNPGAFEECDGLDNNCDGSVDEDLTRPSLCGVGECASIGTETCTGGVWGNNTCMPVPPQHEGPYKNATCTDGKDNDCDSFIDSADLDCYARPDLIVKSVSNPPNARKRGKSFNIKAIVKNQGNASADKEFIAGCYLSKNRDKLINKEADILLAGDVFVSSLLAGASSKRTITVNIGIDTPPGRYYVKVCADKRNDLEETNEDNNCRASREKVRVKK
jgi:hypothetical protein